ncbi:alpha/beta hydrolase [Lujinxingia litoralis]|uniref:Alpha/beta hydrolase n=1 Tax=Lujinxingia litoralis TaxID=2211119 RepID=A0A328C968_9DELT|nr:alpha/beta fold hydrolase [Lujinxingia litoralis]RAL22465.1 alpha/beta hydrolase [Lujinxingia litoralis]
MKPLFNTLILHANRNYYRDQARAVGLEEHVSFYAYTGPEVELHVAVAGPEDGPVVLLLHGFPDTWMGWARQIEALATAGYRVIAPNQRGYDRSDKPRSTSDYRLEALADDVLGILEAIGVERAHIVGHDWGGALTWWLAEHRPDRLYSACVLNCPPLRVLARALWSNPNQFWRSWYMVLFQVPGLAERLLSARHFRALRGALVGEARRGAFSRDEVALYQKVWAQPGALTAMLSWYRAAGLSLREPKVALVDVPLRLIWGTKDSALHQSLIAPSLAYGARSEVRRVEGASHWVQRDKAEEVSALILEHLDAHQG